MSARPFKLKLENGDRKIGIVISSLKELEKESMDCGFITNSEKNQYKIDWTLEDGTIVDSEKYFDNLPDNGSSYIAYNNLQYPTIPYNTLLLHDTSRNGIIGTQKGCIENGESFHTNVLPFFIIILSARLKE